MAQPSPETVFTRDVLGRYVCNTFTEAQESGPFDVIIIGGGTFGLSLAQDLYFRAKRTGAGPVPHDQRFKPPGYRILGFASRPFVLTEATQDVPNPQPYASS